MSRIVTAARAKSELADCIRKAENGETVVITRHGKPVAVLVGADRLASVTRSGADRHGGLATLVGGWKGSAELVRELEKLRRSRARRTVRLRS